MAFSYFVLLGCGGTGSSGTSNVDPSGGGGIANPVSTLNPLGGGPSTNNSGSNLPISNALQPLETGSANPAKDPGGNFRLFIKASEICQIRKGALQVSFTGQVGNYEGHGPEMDGIVLRLQDIERNQYIDTMTHSAQKMTLGIAQVTHGYFSFEIETDDLLALKLFMMKKEFVPGELDTILPMSEDEAQDSQILYSYGTPDLGKGGKQGPLPCF